MSDTIRSSGNNVTITGGAGVNSISSSGANAVITTSGDSDTILTSGANTYINAGEGSATITSEGANATVTGGNGNNDIELLGNNPNVQLGDGANTLALPGDNSNVQLGDGDNALLLEGAAANVTLGDGNNLIVSTAPNITLAAGVGNNTVENQNATAQITIAGGDNLITGIGKGSNVKLGAGRDTVSLTAGATNSNINLGAGDNSVSNTNSNVTITTGAGNSTIGNTASDVNINSGGNDLIVNSGNNLTINSSGTSTLQGMGNIPRISKGVTSISVGNPAVTLNSANGSLVLTDARNKVFFYDGKPTVCGDVMSTSGGTLTGTASTNQRFTNNSGGAKITTKSGCNTVTSWGSACTINTDGSGENQNQVYAVGSNNSIYGGVSYGTIYAKGDNNSVTAFGQVISNVNRPLHVSLEGNGFYFCNAHRVRGDHYITAKGNNSSLSIGEGPGSGTISASDYHTMQIYINGNNNLLKRSDSATWACYANVTIKGNYNAMKGAINHTPSKSRLIVSGDYNTVENRWANVSVLSGRGNSFTADSSPKITEPRKIVVCKDATNTTIRATKTSGVDAKSDPYITLEGSKTCVSVTGTVAETVNVCGWHSDDSLILTSSVAASREGNMIKWGNKKFYFTNGGNTAGSVMVINKSNVTISSYLSTQYI